MNALGDMLLKLNRKNSDVASKVSSDGSSFVGSFFTGGHHQQQALLAMNAPSLESDEEDELLFYPPPQEMTKATDDPAAVPAPPDIIPPDTETDEQRDPSAEIQLYEPPQREERSSNGSSRQQRSRSSSSRSRQRRRNNIRQKRMLRAPAKRRKRFGSPEKPAATSSSSSTRNSQGRTQKNRKMMECLNSTSSTEDDCSYDYTDDDRSYTDDEREDYGYDPEEEEEDAEPKEKGLLRPSNFVRVKVEATAICDLDMAVSMSCIADCHRGGAEADVTGTNFVGTIQQHDENDSLCAQAQAMGLVSGSRVAGIVTSGANALYMDVSPDKLLSVPENLDAADVCAVLSSYLPAFLALHHGRRRPYRYSASCLGARTVLVTSCTSLEAQAAVQLALLAGASHVYVTAPRDHAKVLKHHALRKCKSSTTLLGDEVEDWLPHVRGKMDVVLDYQTFGNRQFEAVRAALAPKGRLVVCSSGRYDNSLSHYCTSLVNIADYCRLTYMKRATIFSLADALESHEEVQSDLDFLMRNLASRRLRPDIDRFIGLKEIPKTMASFLKRPLSGSIICEPWKH